MSCWSFHCRSFHCWPADQLERVSMTELVPRRLWNREETCTYFHQAECRTQKRLWKNWNLQTWIQFRPRSLVALPMWIPAYLFPWHLGVSAHSGLQNRHMQISTQESECKWFVYQTDCPGRQSMERAGRGLFMKCPSGWGDGESFGFTATNMKPEVNLAFSGKN